MLVKKSAIWNWKSWDITWSLSKVPNSENKKNILLVHGFGASKNHWRHNQDFLGNYYNWIWRKQSA